MQTYVHTHINPNTHKNTALNHNLVSLYQNKKVKKSTYVFYTKVDPVANVGFFSHIS